MISTCTGSSIVFTAVAHISKWQECLQSRRMEDRTTDTAPLRLHTTVPYVSKNNTNVAHYNFNAHQLILVIFGRGIAERISY